MYSNIHFLPYRLRNKFTKPKKREISTLAFQKIPGQILLVDSQEQVNCRIFLNDLKTEGVGVFSAAPLEVGQVVSLVMEYPQLVFIRGEVFSCSLYNLNPRVFSQEVFSYRVWIRFRFGTAEEEQHFLEYYNSL